MLPALHVGSDSVLDSPQVVILLGCLGVTPSAAASLCGPLLSPPWTLMLCSRPCCSLPSPPAGVEAPLGLPHLMAVGLNSLGKEGEKGEGRAQGIGVKEIFLLNSGPEKCVQYN